jgi:AcrR family transcriptional regulator
MNDELKKKRCRETSTRKLLEAGVEVFSEVGYDCATTKLVAQRAGVNESLINRYFDGKAGLLVAIIQQASECEGEQKSVCEFPKGETIEQELNNYFEALLDHYEENKDFMRVLFSRAIVDRVISDEMHKQMHRKGGIQRLIADLEDFQKKGTLRADVDIEKAAFAIRGQAFAQGFLLLVVMGIERKVVRSVLAEFSKTFARGLR